MNRISRKLLTVLGAILVILLLAIVIVFVYCGLYPFKKHVKVLTDRIDIGADEFQYTNNIQTQANVWMGSYQKELYFYPHCNYEARKSVYDRWLCVLRNQQVVKLCKIGDGKAQMIGSSNGFIYYAVYSTGSNDKLYCYDIANKKETVLYTGNLAFKYGASLYTASFMTDGALSVPFFSDESGKAPQYLRIIRGEVIDVINQPENYSHNQHTYTIVRDASSPSDHLKVTDAIGNTVEYPLAVAVSRTFIPTSKGCLIHNEGYSAMLYNVDDSQSISLLFELPCLSSSSAVAVVNEDIYLSVKRYEKFGSLGMLRFENDTAEGTYKINQTDFSPVKISDSIYNGLYFFGGESLYACDESCNIYRLDLQGNVIDTVLKVIGADISS